MSKPTLYVNWSLMDQQRKERLAHNPLGCPVVFLDPKNPDPEALASARLLLTDMKASLLPRCRSLEWLATTMAGAAQYCEPGLIPENVPITNSAGAYGVAISEHMLTLTLMLLRRMDQYAEQQRQQGWGLIGRVTTLSECVVTVVGMGDIGANYARRMKLLGAEVRGVRRTAHDKPDYVDALYTSRQLDEALDGANVIAIALPGTNETNGIFTRERLEALRPGSIIVNVGRGSLIDQAALVELLHSGHIGGAGLDVCVPEPLPKGDPLWTAPRTIITPHVSGMNSSSYTLDRILELFFENLARFDAGQPLLRQVNKSLGY